MKKSIILLSIIALSGCGDNTPPHGMMDGKFETLNKCLLIIKEGSHSDLKILTDKPDEVGGWLSVNGVQQDLAFGCQRKETGTEGVYYYGFFETPTQ
jgi:hypothetical protein